MRFFAIMQYISNASIEEYYEGFIVETNESDLPVHMQKEKIAKKLKEKLLAEDSNIQIIGYVVVCEKDIQPVSIEL